LHITYHPVVVIPRDTLSSALALLTDSLLSLSSALKVGEMHVRDYWTPLVPIFSKGYGPYHSPSKHTLTPRITSSSIPESSTTSYILSTTANPTSLTSSEVPPTTTTFLPSAETVTSFVTLTASLPPYNYDIFKPLEDLSPCAVRHPPLTIR